jgi:hypothetical protein
MDLEQFDHPSWFTAAGTLVSYTVILVAMFVLLFVVPYVIFLAI